MPRYIDADELVDEIEEEIEVGNEEIYEEDKLINKGLKIALKDIKKQPTVDAATIIQSGWISVEDKMPEDSGDYMVLNDGRIEIAPYDKEVAQEGLYPFGYEDKEIDEIGNTLIDWIEISGVTHWMPLPELPKDRSRRISAEAEEDRIAAAGIGQAFNPD